MIDVIDVVILTSSVSAWNFISCHIHNATSQYNVLESLVQYSSYKHPQYAAFHLPHTGIQSTVTLTFHVKLDQCDQLNCTLYTQLAVAV